MRRRVVRRNVRIRRPVKVTWSIKCRCGRRFIVRAGTTKRCICGNVFRC